MRTRMSMAETLALGSPNAVTRTFVVEVHTDDPAGYLAGLAGGGRLERTEDAFLFVLHRPEGQFWVDQLDDRFWTVHTDLTMDQAAPFLTNAISQRREVDRMWLPSDHLRRAWPGARTEAVRTDFQGRQLLGGEAPVQQLRARFAGHDVERVLAGFAEFAGPIFSFSQIQAHLSDPALGSISEGMSRDGRFIAAGDSLEFHLQFVRAVVLRYRHLVTLCERKAIRWGKLSKEGELGGIPRGGPIVIQFSQAIPDLMGFANQLFAAREPFRLWGVPSMDDGIVEVDAVDLHIGERLRIDIGQQWMRIYLEEGCCGNTVARLVTNLQHRFDGNLSMADPELQAAITAQDQTFTAVAS